MVDGETDETSKVYSVWLTPSGKTADVFKKAIADLILGRKSGLTRHYHNTQQLIIMVLKPS